MHKKIALLIGDGISVEVMPQAQRVLDKIATLFQHQFTYLTALVGGAAFEQFGSHCPEQTQAICQQADAILFSSVGGPVDQQHLPKWKNCEANSILSLRKYFQFNINLRPIRIYPCLTHLSPLAPEKVNAGIDIAIFRELNGDIYFGAHRLAQESAGRIAHDEAVYTEAQIASIAHAAFKAAKSRNRQLVSVDKANVLATSKLWREVVSEVAHDYPEVSVTHMLVDNAAMQLVLNPGQFDVILTSNLFGDILSDLAAALTGSLGLIPSASINAEGFGLYEPSGGSAPDLAGQNRANPSAQILSAAMLLRYSFALEREAQLIEKAIENTLASGAVTQDIAQNDVASLTTDQFVDKLLSVIDKLHDL